MSNNVSLPVPSAVRRFTPGSDRRLRVLQRRRRLQFGRMAGALGALITVLMLFGGLFNGLSMVLTDLLNVPSPITSNVVIVGIDNDTLRTYGRSVAEWPRTRHAHILDVLSQAGARVVVFDILFTEAAPDDPAFAASIARATDSETRTRVVLASYGEELATQDGVVPAAPYLYYNVLQPVSALLDEGVYTGHVNAYADRDSRVRVVPIYVTTSADGETGRELSLGTAAYAAYLRIPTTALDSVIKPTAPDQVQVTAQRTIQVDPRLQMVIHYFGPPGAIPHYSYQPVSEGIVDPELFRDKIVLIGMYNATGATDAYLTPVSSNSGLMPGVEIHANQIETLLQNKPLYPAPLVPVAILSSIGLLIYALIAVRIRLWQTALLFFLCVLGLIVIASVVFSTSGAIVPYFYPLVGLAVTQLAVTTGGVRWERLERQQTQRLLDSADHLIEKRFTLNDIVRQIAVDAADLTGATASTIHVQSEESGQLREQFHSKPPADHELQTITALAQQASSSRQTVTRQGFTSVPMLFQSACMGTITVQSATHNSVQRGLDETARTLLEIYAELTAPALSASQLYTLQLRQRDLLANILNSSPDPVIVLNTQLHVTRLNEAAAGLLSPPDGLVDSVSDSVVPRWEGLPLREIWMTSGYKEPGFAALESKFRQAASFEAEVTLGEQQYVALGAPLNVVDGGWVLVLHDITSLRQLDAMRTQMLRMASHDLKNPLGVIMGYVELLLEEDITNDQRALLDRVLTNALRMKTIIGELLNLERLRSGAVNLEHVDLSALVDDVIVMYTHQADEKKQKLTLKTTDHVGEHLEVMADLPQLREAISNLVGNAIKYTPDGGMITITLNTAAGKSGDRARLSVQDTGYGIPKQAQDKLFTPFYRVRTAETAKISGTGLGLSLVKTVIEAHQGTITVDSEQGKGSTFTVDLPLAKVATEATWS